MNYVRCKANRTFRIKRREYLKDTINELETYSKKKNIRDFYRAVSEFKESYQARSNFIKDKNDDLPADAHSILKSMEELLLPTTEDRICMGLMTSGKLKHTTLSH